MILSDRFCFVYQYFLVRSVVLRGLTRVVVGWWYLLNLEHRPKILDT